MPVEQHPVPQHISSYEFRLIGDMTLKQFGYLFAGCLVALLFYALPIPGFFKWPLVAGSGFSGFAFAFLPIEDRPLASYVGAFVKDVFAPTLFIWEKRNEMPLIFVPIHHTQPQKPSQQPLSDKTQLDAYLSNFQTDTEKIDDEESSRLKQVAELFKITTTVTNQPKAPLPAQEVKPRIFTQPIVAPTPTVRPTAKPIKKAAFVPQPKPKTKGVVVQADTRKNLPFPTPPTIPNIIAGMVIDKNDNIIEGAILEIKSPQGMSVRALKTNRLGQFSIATPLNSGSYEIVTEKEGYNFDIIKIEAKGETIKPIEIKAK